MIHKLMASLAAAAPLFPAALLGIGVGAVTEPGIGVATFGGAWFLLDLVDHIRGAG